MHSGFNQFFNPDAMGVTDLNYLLAIENDCNDVYELLTSGDDLFSSEIFGNGISDDSKNRVKESGKVCLQSLLGDNPIGNFIRFMNDNLDSLFSCTSDFGRELPRCVLSASSPDGTDASFPLSLMKKSTCVLGWTYDMILGEFCLDLYDGLDACLPEVDATFDSDSVAASCDDRGVFLGKRDDFLGMDMSVLTENKIPAFCSKVFIEKDMGTEGLQSRMNYYNKNREYGWTVKAPEDTTSNNAIAISSQNEFSKTNMSPFVSVKSPVWDEAIDESAKTNFVPMLAAAGLIVLTSAFLFLFFKRSSSTHHSGDQYSHVSLDISVHGTS